MIREAGRKGAREADDAAPERGPGGTRAREAVLRDGILREVILGEARAWIGTPYRHQGRCRGAGADCLGLILGIWEALYGALPASPGAYEADWAEAGGQERLLQAARLWLIEKPRAEARPGDVVLFRMREGGIAKHLGLLSAPLPSGAFIHAYSGHAVTESPLSAPWARRIAGVFAFPPI